MRRSERPILIVRRDAEVRLEGNLAHLGRRDFPFILGRCAFRVHHR